MALAEKIIWLRKKNGWSQEELAERMQVSRQAVSKWESAQSTPELDKILLLADLFGVTTDFLLKDGQEAETVADEAGAQPRRISLALANDYIAWRKSASIRIAIGTFLCVAAPAPLLLLAVASQTPGYGGSQSAAVAGGLTVLLVLVAVAVSIFIFCGFHNAPFDFIDKEPFETEHGVAGMVKGKQKDFRNVYVLSNIIGACVCILSPIPLFIGAFSGRAFFMVSMLVVTMLLAGGGAAIFIVAGVRWASMQKLLKEGEFAVLGKKENRIKEAIATVFWLSATAIYLAWSFWTNAWGTTWIVWPVAGVLFAAVECVCNLLLGREES